MLQDCSCSVKPAVNLNTELLCGDQLLFEINKRKSLILVLRSTATISICNHLTVHGKHVALLRRWTPFSAAFLEDIVKSWSYKIAYIWVENIYLVCSELHFYSKHCIVWKVKVRDRKNARGRFFSGTGIWLLIHHSCILAVLSHNKPWLSKILT